jgi:hypothetical protein
MLLLAILVYLLLDFSLPTMPGAFVFEPAESVETIQVNRSRADSEVVVALPLAKSSCVASLLQADLTGTFGSGSEVTPVVRPVVDHLPRANLHPAPPTEDPH